jgi:hypothetical protein
LFWLHEQAKLDADFRNPSGEKPMTKQFQTVVCLLLIFAATLLKAQTIAFKVPFNFLIANKSFPAGEYFVSGAQDHLTVRDASGKPIFSGIVNAVSGRQVGKNGLIVFRCYEDSCFLSEYWNPTREFGSQLLASHFEKELAKQRSAADFALLEEPEKL